MPKMPDATRLSVIIVGENGDVSIQLMRDGTVSLTIRDLADQESHATLRLTFDQAQAVATLLQNAEADEDDEE